MEIFIQNIEDIADINELVSNLPPERYKKYLSYRNEEDKSACILGFDMIRKNVSSDEILINKFGKPYIKGASYFNISHSGKYVLLAKNETPIGCDIEQIKDIDVQSVAKYSFHQKEIETLKSLNWDLNTFYKLWTIKESYVKMLGLGMSKDFKSFFVDLNSLKINENDNLIVHLDETIPNYVIACVY